MTEVPDLPRNAQFKALGNIVVPQFATHFVHELIEELNERKG